jgi:hypothetical protein
MKLATVMVAISLIQSDRHTHEVNEVMSDKAPKPRAKEPFLGYRFICVICRKAKRIQADYRTANAEIGQLGWRILPRTEHETDYGLHCQECSQ